MDVGEGGGQGTRAQDTLTVRVHHCRKHLPHWRAPGATYWVTWRLHRSQSALRASERDAVASVLSHFDGHRFCLHAFVVMDDHIHLIVTPYEGFDLEQIVHSWKSVSTWQLQREYQRRGAIWQHDYYDRIVRGPGDFQQKLQYLRRNPSRRWPDIREYRWMWPRARDG